jgi:hypothetical protein
LEGAVTEQVGSESGSANTAHDGCEHGAPGALGEEAVRLLIAAQEWFQRSVLATDTAKIATGTPECAWCPVCLLVAGLRGEGELAGRVGEVRSAVTGLLRAVADAAASPPAATPYSEAEAPPQPRVHKIDLSEEV